MAPPKKPDTQPTPSPEPQRGRKLPNWPKAVTKEEREKLLDQAAGALEGAEAVPDDADEREGTFIVTR
jgi:hypothetical protein